MKENKINYYNTDDEIQFQKLITLENLTKILKSINLKKIKMLNTQILIKIILMVF